MLITCRSCGLYFDKDTEEIGTDVRKWIEENWLCKRCLKPTRRGTPLVDNGVALPVLSRRDANALWPCNAASHVSVIQVSDRLALHLWWLSPPQQFHAVLA